MMSAHPLKVWAGKSKPDGQSIQRAARIFLFVELYFKTPSAKV